MDISLFLTSQNASAKDQQAVDRLSESFGSGRNSPGFFGALVEQMNAQIANAESANFAATQVASTEADDASAQSNTLATVLSIGESLDENGEIIPSSLLSISGADLLTLLRTAIPEGEEEAFDVIQTGENSLTLSIKGTDGTESIPFILNGFFTHTGLGQDAEATLEQYKDQLSDGLRDFLAQAQDIAAAQGNAGDLLNGYTPEEITRIGDEIAAILTKLVSQNQEIELETAERPLDDIDVAFAIHDRHAAETDIRLEIEAEIKAEEELELEKEQQAEEALEALAEELSEEIAQDIAAIESLAHGFITLVTPQDVQTAAATATTTATTAATFLLPDGTVDLNYRNSGKADLPVDAELKADLGGKQASGKDDLPTATPNKGESNAKSTPEFSQLLSSLTGLNSGLLAGGIYTDSALEQFGLSLNGTTPIAQTGFTTALTQAQSAAHAHPATNLVSATIKNAAANGNAKTITLHLHPSELGRVEVKMEFGENKALKAVITAERPETFMMMQRDASTLERALQEAGLDTQGGLSFELAEHGFDSDQQNQRGGGHDKGGTGAGSNDNEEEVLIESEMTWRVDPETGHMRYNILA